jgi:hypothetical protein
MMTTHTGSCLCGQVSFSIEGPLAPGLACHCKMCRKQTGIFLASTEIDRDALRISGEEHLCWYESSDKARRGFCANCGSVLFWEEKGSDRISPTLGPIDGPTGVKLARHIYTADKGDYYEIDEARPERIV